MFTRLVFTVGAFALAGCTSLPQILDSSKFYKRDMEIKVNGHAAEGVIVARQAGQYGLKVEAKGDLDLFTFATCHREQTKEQAGESGWFRNKRKRELTYRPAPLERDGTACPVRLGGFEKVNGRHSWALIEFEHSSLKLPARLQCNGSVSNTSGVSICQSRAGLIQAITFPVKTMAAKTAASPSCPPLASDDGLTYRFEMPLGECTYRFMTASGEEQSHRLTVLGYNGILIRTD